MAVPCMSWSHGFSKGGGYGSYQVRPPKKVTDEQLKFKEWTEDQLHNWATEVGCPGLAKALKAARVDGKAIQLFGRDDYDKLPEVSFAERRRFEGLVRELSTQVEEQRMFDQAYETVQSQDLSCTIYLGAHVGISLFAPMLSQEKLTRVALVVYTAGKGG